MIRLGAVVCILLIIVGGYLIVSGPEIRIGRIEFPPLKISFKTSNINGFSSIRFFSKTRNEYVWSISLSDQPIKEITYGVIPKGGIQRIPKEGRPKPLRLGERIFLRVIFQYDSWQSADISSKTWELQVEKESIKILGERPDIKLPPIDK
jgi:hypothetical protein